MKLMHSIDRALGCEHQQKPSKVHKAFLAQEFYLARLVTNITNPHFSWVVDNPVCKWDGVLVSKNGDIDKILWSFRALQGHMNFAYLPKTLRSVELRKNLLVGRLNLGREADHLERIDLDHNSLDSELALGALPRKLRSFWAQFNQLHGGLDLTALPQMLTELMLDRNKFSGAVFFGALPSTLSQLWLGHNNLEGCLDLSVLPDSLDTLQLHNNSFTGRLDFSRVPSSIKQLALARNKFEGEVDISQLTDSVYFISIFDNHVTLYVDKECAPHDLKKICVYDPPRKNLQISKLPTRFAKWDTENHVWYAYHGVLPQVCEEAATGVISSDRWWKPLDVSHWKSFDV